MILREIYQKKINSLQREDTLEQNQKVMIQQ